MSKKLIMACMAVVAFAAFALPAVASATNKPTLVEGATGSTPVKVGEKITATNIGNTLFVDTSSNTLITCTTAHLTGKVVRNDSGFVEGTIETATFAGSGAVSPHNGEKECTGTDNAYITVPSLPLCIRSTPAMVTHEFQVGAELAGKTCAEGLGNVRFIIGGTIIGACEYESTSTIKGDFTTSDTTSELKVRTTQAGSGSKLIKGGFFCPSSGMLNMKFELETDPSNTPVNITQAP